MRKLLLDKIKFFKVILTQDIVLLVVSALFSLRWLPGRYNDLFFYTFSVLSIVLTLVFIIKRIKRRPYFQLGRQRTIIYVFLIFSIMITILSGVLYFPDNKNFILYLSYLLIFTAFILISPIERKMFFETVTLLIAVTIIQYIIFLLINKGYYSVYGLALNKSTLANVLVIYFFIFLHSIKKLNTLSFIYAAIIVLIILLTGARTAIVGLLISSILVFSFRYNKKELVVFFFIFGSILGLIIYGLYLWRPDSVKGRLLLWKSFLSSSRSIQDLFFGKGVGYSEYKAQMFLKLYMQNSNTPEQLLAGSTFSTMNEYLKIFVDSGLIGVILFVALLYITSYYFIIRKKVFLLAANISFMSVSMFSYPLYFPFIWIMMLFLWTYPGDVRSKIISCKALYFKIGSALMICIFLFVAYRISIYSFYLIKWNGVQNNSNYLYDEPGFQKSYNILNKQLNNNPYFLSDYAQKLQSLSRFERSKKILERAVEIEPTAERLMMLGYNCEMTHLYDSAEYYYKRAIQTQPKLFRPRYLLFNLYVKLDKRNLAKDAATRILLFPVKVPSEDVEKIKDVAKKYLSDPYN